MKGPRPQGGISDVSLTNGKGWLLISAWNILPEEKIHKSRLQEEVYAWLDVIRKDKS